MASDHRQEAQALITRLAALLQSGASSRTATIVSECEALSRAVAAFHMEGIRFRIFNVDRLLRAAAEVPGTIPEGAAELLEGARRHLEAAGFHTRSHQAPI